MLISNNPSRAKQRIKQTRQELGLPEETQSMSPPPKSEASKPITAPKMGGGPVASSIDPQKETERLHELQYGQFQNLLKTAWPLSNVKNILGGATSKGFLPPFMIWSHEPSHEIPSIVHKALQDPINQVRYWNFITYMLGPHLGHVYTEARIATFLALMDFLYEEVSSA